MMGIDRELHFYKWLRRIYTTNRETTNAKSNGISDLKEFAAAKLGELSGVLAKPSFGYALAA